MSLSTRLFVFSSIFLVMLPVSAYYFIGRIEQTILQGQQDAQAMTAATVATVVQGYTDLFNIDEDALYVYPLKRSILIDGYASDDEDWTALKDRFVDFGDNSDVHFSLLLLDDSQYLYAYLKVQDRNIVYRNPRYMSLDSSDHIRLEYIDSKQQHRRLVLLAEGQGNVSVYEVKPDWQTWISGQHVSAVYAVWHETPDGYDVELRLPEQWLQPQRRLSISLLNVFNENERNPDTIISTQVLDSHLLNPLLLRSTDISLAIKNFGELDSQICVIDKYRRVRAVIGGSSQLPTICQATDRVNRTLVDDILKGKRLLINNPDSDSGLIIAGHPVFAENETIGAVLVSSSRQQILAKQRDTLLAIMLTSLTLFLLVIISLLLFSSRLAFRINRLKNQSTALIDDSGRFIHSVDLPDSQAGDEIGELSRSFSLLLGRLNTYTCFLETVPRMLRHEILNPVNTISMSLQNLQNTSAATQAERNIKVANDAIKQLQLIVSSLTEAANIEESLTQDVKQHIDIAALLDEYVANSQRKHVDVKLCYQGVKNNVFVLANDIRLVQLLDKLKDNAIDFSLPGTEIIFQLDVNQGQQVIIRVKNEGDIIPQQRLDTLFKGMVSYRSEKTATPHLGIGLYVACQIAGFHQGQLTIANRRDKQGVEVSLRLPEV